MRYSPPENHPESGCHDGGGRTMQSTAALSRGPSGPAQARLLGDSLAVELSALTRAALVRIQVPQPVPQENPAKSVSYRARRRSVSHGCITEVYHKHRLWRRSEEHTSELQSLMRNSYAVICLKKKINTKQTNTKK